MKMTIESLDFPSEIKNKLKMKVSTTNLKFKFLPGHIIKFNKTNNLWKELTKEQKQYLINKYIDEIEIDYDKDYNVSIVNILFNKNEIENIGYMFRSDCFDMIVNVNERDIILSNVKNKVETDNYIATLRNFYNIKETTIHVDSFDITKFSTDDVIQIIPQKKSSKFEKNKFTILQIEVR